MNPPNYKYVTVIVNEIISLAEGAMYEALYQFFNVKEEYFTVRRGSLYRYPKA